MYNVLIIGGGISGIMSLKHLLDEGEKSMIVLNKNPEPFGVWNIRNHPSVLDFTYSVSSRLYMTITDFPLDESVPEFPHHSAILDYYKKYADHFNLLPYVKNNIEVIKVEKINNIWNIHTKNKIYKSKNIIIATGAVNNCLNYPNDKFFDKFIGEKYHCDSYKEYRKDLINKRILVVGGSDTACDIAVNLCEKNNVTLSMKNGRWFQPRFSGANNAADVFYSRMTDLFIKNLVGKKYINNTFGLYDIKTYYGKFGSGIKEWEPKCDYLNDYYVKSRDVVDAVAKGKIKPRKYVESIDKKNIKFVDNDEVSEYDVILFCTGYNTKGCFNFLDKSYDKKYKQIFVPGDKSIFFVGFIRPYLTAIPMLVELQTRWVAKVIVGKVQLQSEVEMLREIGEDRERQMKEFPCAYGRVPIVDPYDYCNMIGKKIGAMPNLYKLFFTNNTLWKNIMFDSWNHHVFRLNDENIDKVRIAEENIMEYNSNDTSNVIRETIVTKLKIGFGILIFLVLLVVVIIIFCKKRN